MKEIKENTIWNLNKIKKLKKFILTKSKEQSSERKHKNELLSKKYKKEDKSLKNINNN